MLCTMCTHGVDVEKLWICSCLEPHCHHIQICAQCGLAKRTLYAEGLKQRGRQPLGRQSDIIAWRRRQCHVPVRKHLRKPRS